MKRLVVFFATLLLVSEFATAQSFYAKGRNRNVVASVGTGVSSYFGDLNNPGDLLDTRLNVNVGLQYLLGPRASIRGELTFFQLQGSDVEASDEGRVARNLSFVSNNIEVNAVVIVNLLPNGLRFYQRFPINPYAFAGLGFTYFEPRAERSNGEFQRLRPLQTEGNSYGPVTLVIPAGAGVKFKVSPFINIALEGGFRFTFTDYLDDVSTVFVDNSSFTDPIAAELADRRPEIGLPLRPEGSTRGNPDDNDAYFVANVKLEYYLPGELFSFRKKYSRGRNSNSFFRGSGKRKRKRAKGGF
ncbi:MAG: DUF6089 family protein [Bacteroidota bacterium]